MGYENHWTIHWEPILQEGSRALCLVHGFSQFLKLTASKETPPENGQFQGTGLVDQKSVHLVHTFHTHENDIFKKKPSDDDAKAVSSYVQRMAISNTQWWAYMSNRVGMVEHWPEKNGWVNLEALEA